MALESKTTSSASDITSKDAVSGKKPYEVPALTIVKFMFENNITWGSFEYDQQGSDDAGNTASNQPESDWWD